MYMFDFLFFVVSSPPQSSCQGLQLSAGSSLGNPALQ